MNRDCLPRKKFSCHCIHCESVSIEMACGHEYLTRAGQQCRVKIKHVHDVLALMQLRYQSGSKPLARQDDSRLAVVLEGGSSRAAYGGGMVTALERAGMLATVDAVYGSSAGALNGAWFVCQRASDNIHGWWDPTSMHATIRPRNMLRGKPVVDTDVIVYDLYENLTPMGFAEILSSDVEYHPIATDAATGQAVDLAPTLRTKADVQNAMRATARLPLLGGKPVQIGTRRFIDGGVAENTPVRIALEQGATHVLALRTKAPSLEPLPVKKAELALVTRWMRRHAPGAIEAWQTRNDTKLELERIMASDARVLQVAPDANAPHISVTGRSEATQRQAVVDGFEVMARTLSTIGVDVGPAPWAAAN